MIEIKNLKLNKNGIDVLSELSMDIEDYSVTCILGNKNSGKSSILKSIVGIYRDYYGEILYDGQDILDTKEMIVDILHENRENDSLINVYEYLCFYGSLYGMDNQKELDDYIEKMLKKFLLLPYKYTSINILDDYDYKFVELIRVLMHNPKVILFDNVFVSDNNEFNDKMYEYIKSLIGKKTIIFASRNLNHIEEILTHIAIIDNGSLVIFGKKEDVYKAAELNEKIQIDIIGGVTNALEILNKNNSISDIIYSDNSITFSLTSDISNSENREELESLILKELIMKGIKVSSFKRQRARFEQLYERLVS